MSVVSLSKIQFFGLRESENLFFEKIQSYGNVDFCTIDTDNFKKQQLSSTHYLMRLRSVLDILEAKFPASLKEKMSYRFFPEEEFFSLENQKDDFFKIIDKIISIQESLSEIKNKQKDIQNKLESIFPLKDFGLSWEGFNSTEYLSVFFGKISDEKIKDLDALCETMDCDFELIAEHGGLSYVLFFCLKQFTPVLSDELKLLGFSKWDGVFPETGSFKALYTSLLDQKLSFEQKVENKLLLINSFGSELSKLQLFYDYLTTQSTKDIVRMSVEESQFLFSISGYVPTRSLTELNILLESIPGCEMTVLEISEEDEVPSLIQNTNRVRPFEFVTDMYSRPGKEDLDPTPLFAPFFSIFMGIAIGDAGVGFVLSLISWFVIKKCFVHESTKKLMGVCFWGGLLSIVIGVLTGTYFAIPFEKFGIHIFYLYKPEEQIMFALGLSFVLGYIHITFAYLVRFFHLLNRGDVFSAFADGLTHIIVMLCGVLLMLGLEIPSCHYLVDVSMYLFIIDVLVIWATSGRHYSNAFLGRILWGLYGVYELTAIVGDILSYARLFALGLAGGIIASAINQLSPQLIHGISFHSAGSSISSILMIIIFILVLLIGHIFAAVLAILGAFIHTMRLQFVEFFGKFFAGGGVAFEPLKIESSYYSVVKQHNHTVKQNIYNKK